MSLVRRFALSSLSTSIHPEAQERQLTIIRHHPHRLKRFGGHIIHAAIIGQTELSARLLGVELQQPDLPYVGSGYQSIAFLAAENVVLKVNHKSIGLPKNEQVALAHAHHTEYQNMARHLGDMALPQITFVAPHPYMRHATAVQVAQPYCPIQNTDIFIDRNPTPNLSALANLQSAHPEAWSQLPTFIERSHRLYDEERLVPDTLGDGNLVINTATRHLLMIDGQPVVPQNKENQRLILDQLSSLERALERAA